MDNVTHSLIGTLLARTFGERLPGTRGVTLAAILASNVPDLDLVVRIGADDPALSYLVHHRGFTHTFVTTPLTALIATLAGALFEPACRARPGSLFLLSLLAAVLHIGADGWNNYGIHPLWPVWSGWFYGDTVFIVEPLLWAVMLPILSGRWRWLGWAITLAGAGLAMSMLGVPTSLGFLALYAVATWSHRRWGEDATWALGGLILASFVIGSEAVERKISAALPGTELLDIARSPRPATPWCWDVLVSEKEGEIYRVRRATVSLLPPVTAPADCAFRLPEGQTFSWDLPDRPGRPDIHWEGVWAAPTASLPQDCRAAVFLRFARVPAWQALPDPDAGLVIGDLRYDLEPELGFAEVPLAPGDTRGCGVDAPWSSATVRALAPEAPAEASPP